MTSESAKFLHHVAPRPVGGVLHLPHLEITQRLAAAVTRYEIREVTAGHQLGRFLAIAQQERLTMRERVSFFADEARQMPSFSSRAFRVLDISPVNKVVDATGAPIGSFQKDFTAGARRSSFHLEGTGFKAYGQERSRKVEPLRRLSTSQFTFIDGVTRDLVMTVERRSMFCDSYAIDVPDTRVDFRLAVAISVGLDLDMQP